MSIMASIHPIPARATARRWLTAAAVALLTGFVAPIVQAQETTITMWSDEADQPSKVAWREMAARAFEKKNPGVKVKITWFDKPALYAALKTALRAGQAPDIFYDEPDQVEYITNGFLLRLDDLVEWRSIHEWARKVWTHGGKTYALPQEVYTVELYYNKELMKKLGVDLPPNGQVNQAQFLDIVKKAAAAGTTPIVQGVGDRPYPGAYVLEETLLKKLGRDDYGKLLAGKLSYKDPRVVQVFTYVKSLVDAGAYPKSFATLKLGESHYYFHTKPGGLMFPMGSWYTARAFVSPDKGGQPASFPLGVMSIPAVEGDASAPECKTLAVASELRDVFEAPPPRNARARCWLARRHGDARPGASWLEHVLLQTAIKTDLREGPGASTRPTSRSFGRPQRRAPVLHRDAAATTCRGSARDTFVQVHEPALPGGLMTVSDAAPRWIAALHGLAG